MSTSLERFLTLWLLSYHVLATVPQVIILILEGLENTKNDKNTQKPSREKNKLELSYCCWKKISFFINLIFCMFFSFSVHATDNSQGLKMENIH